MISFTLRVVYGVSSTDYVVQADCLPREGEWISIDRGDASPTFIVKVKAVRHEASFGVTKVWNVVVIAE